MAKTLDEGFEAFIKKLAPLETEHDKAKNHKESVKSCLESKFKCYRFFETGSFGNGTGVRHYSDTDYFSVIPNEETWTSSRYTLRMVKEALQVKFWSTEDIKVLSPAVRIPFGSIASETMEVTPCVFKGLQTTSIGQYESFAIANGNDEWMLSSPTAHNKYVKEQDERLRGKLKPLIQMIKAWKFYNNVPIRSFYLELRVTKYAESENAIVYSIDIKNIMNFLNNNKLSKIQDPMGISGYIDPCASDTDLQDALSKTSTGATRAEKANAERDGDLNKAFEWGDMFFNYQFPSR